MGLSFSQPAWLFLGVVPLLLSLLRTVRPVPLSRMGQPDTVAAQFTPRNRWTRWNPLILTLAWVLLALGVSGPRWGQGGEAGVAIGRDLTIVLDLSRSMLAADMVGPPERWQAAVVGTRDLVGTLRQQGGYRVGIVVFAARPALLVPLTTDLDHVDAVLADLDGRYPPPTVRPGHDDPRSGTRIGAALQAAVAAQDPRFTGARAILLLSDGDDPADDQEWQAGVTAARTANIPIAVVGIGDPERDSPIILDGEFLEHTGPTGIPSPVQTRLAEATLRQIATAAQGAYYSAHRVTPALGPFVSSQLDALATRILRDDGLPQPRDRSAWFLTLALILLMLGWWPSR
ncbi:MAG: VWA domain-containing protein [Bacteroidales bacterium]|nr:VWA domain-containing protein [Bacteroidales bacterium]